MQERDHDREPKRAEPGVRPDRVDTSPPQTDRSPAGPDPDRQIAQEPQQSTGDRKRTVLTSSARGFRPPPRRSTP
jgi:hypothetical protein